MKRFLTTTLAALALLITAGCGEDPGINNDLPDINIPTDTPGEFQYSCGMRMFFGKVIIK